MSITLGAHKPAAPEMNVTPLIDVLLVLLIIFMILPHHRGERAEIPQASTHHTSEDPVVIQLISAGDREQPSFKISGEAVAADALERRLREIFLTRTDKTAFLKGDPEIDFQYVAEAIDLAHQAGVEHVGLMGRRD